MIGIAFTSSMQQGLSKSARAVLVEDARIRNQKADISSVLLCCDGSFMQYMEGPQQQIDAIYGAIEADSRHRGVIKLFEHALVEREFGGAPMHYYESGDAEVDAEAVSAWLQPKAGWSNPARVILSSFWSNNNGLRTVH